MNRNSSILMYACPITRLSIVIEKIQKAELPILVEGLGIHTNFNYDGVCDGNTAHHLERIISSLIYLYKKD